MAALTPEKRKELERLFGGNAGRQIEDLLSQLSEKDAEARAAGVQVKEKAADIDADIAATEALLSQLRTEKAAMEVEVEPEAEDEDDGDYIGDVDATQYWDQLRAIVREEIAAQLRAIVREEIAAHMDGMGATLKAMYAQHLGDSMSAYEQKMTSMLDAAATKKKEAADDAAVAVETLRRELTAVKEAEAARVAEADQASAAARAQLAALETQLKELLEGQPRDSLRPSQSSANTDPALIESLKQAQRTEQGHPLNSLADFTQRLFPVAKGDI